MIDKQGGKYTSVGVPDALGSFNHPKEEATMSKSFMVWLLQIILEIYHLEN
jgi:hypothetical protein